ncbi:uncharacterized protein I303_105724 [Kwoniella dejecticola CBS 10117]|uniref:Uncharacterized protein n=1 Tax=Kwoniella dejecticola CBS 10117 TaxID=1296121 RepID=A0A1A6A077_9TREE|nr:uncharacterized protein I303_05746 [Kwoniella dejecticola CBS 10117]OBR83467.1 hypothetical protein I303_05746 [Kwoniella dejecticola CBS 10117]
MIMTSSPILTPSCRSIAHTPSPSSSPKLRPVASTMIKPTPTSTGTSASAASQNPFATSNGVPITASSLPTRSYVRGPQARPYAATKTPKNVDGDTKKFAELVATMVTQLGQQRRKGELIEMIENVNLSSSPSGKPQTGSLAVPKRNRSVAGSLAGSWEVERAELIVDIPVWSPGCFQDLSTLHALRDTTLSHTHALLSHLSSTHNTPATYRLLARSCAQPNHQHHSSHHHGWGCIRLAPSISSPISAPLELKPQVRRASLVRTHSSPMGHSARGKSRSPPRYGVLADATEKVIVESEDEDEFEVKLKEGYSRSNISTDSESEDDEEESADVIVGREIEKRGGKEGMAFLMTLFGQPALILT